jgi:hypothetical protein
MIARRAARPAFLLVLTLLVPGLASADRRLFVQTYTPYLAPGGESELELWTAALVGRGDSTSTDWVHRAELEYAISNRLTGSFYLNYVQPNGAKPRWDGSSLELIYALADPGRLPLDPAVYLEVTGSGDEFELEPKLLGALRHGAMVGALNLIGEFEKPLGGAGEGEWQKTWSATAGLSRVFGPHLAVGVETVYHRRFDEALGNPSALLLGPTVSMQGGEAQLAVGWHPQVWGDPSSAASLDLRDFARSEFRLVLGLDL